MGSSEERLLELILHMVKEHGGHGSYNRCGHSSLMLIFGGHIIHVVAINENQTLSPASEAEKDRLIGAGSHFLAVSTFEEFTKWWTCFILEIENKMLRAKVIRLEKKRTRKRN